MKNFLMTSERHITRQEYEYVRPAVNAAIAHLRDTHLAFVDVETRVRAIRAARLSATATALAMEERKQWALARRKAAHDKARIDPMTGIDCRRGYDESVRRGIIQAMSTEVPATLVMLDLNDMHQINRNQGRLEGDRQIRTVARILQECSDPAYPPARWGGDEYGVLYVGANQADIKEWWRHAIQPRLTAEGIHISAGSATYEPWQETSFDIDSILDGLTQRADLALYSAKTESKIQKASLLFVSEEEAT